MSILKGYTKQEISWMMYDWANSAHSVIIVTILPIFFDSVAECTADSVSSMSTWGYATSIAMAIVALAAPFLGVFGDIRGMRKKLFAFFLGLGVLALVASALLYSIWRTARRPADTAAWWRRNGPLFAACAFLTLFAVTNNITFGSWTLSIPIPQALTDLCGIFRSSGRKIGRAHV